jgi:hypothetical protein
MSLAPGALRATPPRPRYSAPSKIRATPPGPKNDGVQTRNWGLRNRRNERMLRVQTSSGRAYRRPFFCLSLFLIAAGSPLSFLRGPIFENIRRRRPPDECFSGLQRILFVT